MEFFELSWKDVQGDQAAEETEDTFFEDDFYPADLVLGEDDLQLLASSEDPLESSSESASVATDKQFCSDEASTADLQVVKKPNGTSENPQPAAKKITGAKVESEESEEEKNRRRAIVAAASRATRAKRKREREALQMRNKELEKEREIYLSRIARLQTEVQAFRDAGSANLEMENKLLRVEIRKHKAFIRTIVEATRAVPRLTPEERYRLFRKGTESAVSQIVGLMFTSMADASWTWSTLTLQGPEGTQIPCHTGVQPLPLGCSAQTTKRVNGRIDLPLRPESIEELAQKLWTIWTNEDPFVSLYTRPLFGPQGVTVSLEELDTGFEQLRDATDPDLRVFHYKEESSDGSEKTRDCINAVTWRVSKALTSSAFPSPLSGDGTLLDLTTLQGHDGGANSSADGEVKCKGSESSADDTSKSLFRRVHLDPGAAFIICSSTSKDDVGLKPIQEGVHRIGDPLIEGHVLRRGPGGKGCLWTNFVSLPLLDEGFAGCSADGTMFTKDFAPGETAVGMLNELLVMLNEMD
ncbi:Hypothetical Protein FCC1311_003912 [Hondaea fermentalgiana]|uniref:BZIP domain-containing protein n=1 Tax=Hondaea fermentalgiana TaxID=2315210 RepID=A0A2R5G6U5_9STRA|nr:Hypothetical Protein FCC1311_003912 [Hondaea fermentalgiana]|eukprot:GBG24173.1 Hypothetical Protein FCC1311_003912 [Hondaea fermentalgiana]